MRASATAVADLDIATGAWISQLCLVVINAAHPAPAHLDDGSYEAMLTRVAWHEWAHALAVVRATRDDSRTASACSRTGRPSASVVIPRRRPRYNTARGERCGGRIKALNVQSRAKQDEIAKLDTQAGSNSSQFARAKGKRKRTKGRYDGLIAPRYDPGG